MRVLVVEDDPAMAAMLTRGLRREGYAVDTVGTGVDAVWTIVETPYDVVVLDAMIPAPDGFEVCRQVRAKDRWMPVLMLTARGDTADKVRGLDAGADDYLIKPYDPAELLARLRAVERRRSSASTPVLHFGKLEIDLARDLVRKDGLPVTLTQKEWALLRVMATRPERIHTRENLADALYGFGDEADSNTLEVFISRLRRKLGRSHIQTLRGLGYRLSFSPEEEDE